MDSIIAHQKIDRRRGGSGSSHRPAERRPYPSLELNGAREASERSAMKQAPRRRSPRLPRSGFRLPGFSALAAPLSRAASLLRGSAGSRLLAAIRSLGARSSKAPKPRFAIAAILAGVLAAAFGLTFLLGEPSFPMPEAALLPEGEASPSALLDYASPELADGAGDSDQGSSNLPPVPAALEMSSYTVRSSDSLASIARRFGLNVDTLISVNGISSARSLRSGAQLRVPNINGLVYKVRPGDSLASVAKRYKMDPTKIVDVNDLGTADLSVGQSLFIPGARLPQAVVSQAMGQAVAWPARGPLSSFFGYRPDPFTGVRRFHAGIDIAVDQGTVVRAAMSGRVSDTGFNANYGNYIIMNHADGFQTLYGHLSSILVHEGMSVDQGAQIGLSGSTGYSTGPHLHFGIFRRSLALNPLKFLK